MRLVFMGNGPFAVPILEAICRSPHAIGLVVARPDRPSGKHRRVEPGPVAHRAMELGCAIEQPANVNDSAFISELVKQNADLLVVADFGQILSRDCLEAARRGGVNAHASLLPKYRGAAPVAWAIYHGESETGVSIIQMSSRMDAGGVLVQESLPIYPSETAGELESRLAHLAATLTLRAIDGLAAGGLIPQRQDEGAASRAPKLTKEDGRIAWSRSARQIADQIRAMQPWPVAFAEWQSARGGDPVRVQILSATPQPGSAGGQPGVVLGAEEGLLRIVTGDGELAIERVRPAGSREMDAQAFINGQRASVGDRFN